MKDKGKGGWWRTGLGRGWAGEDRGGVQVPACPGQYAKQPYINGPQYINGVGKTWVNICQPMMSDV